MLKIRLRRQGRRNAITYRLIVTDARTPRDGKYLEVLGHYNPNIEGEKELQVSEERVSFWLSQGAQPSEKAHALIKRAAPGALAK